MNGRKLSLVLMLVLCGSCLIAPPTVFGENPWDPDKPVGGNHYNYVVDTTEVDDTSAVDTSLINGSVGGPGEPIQPQSAQSSESSWVPYWLIEFMFYSGMYLGF